jgi:hypothetical protein
MKKRKQCGQNGHNYQQRALVFSEPMCVRDAV